MKQLTEILPGIWVVEVEADAVQAFSKKKIRAYTMIGGEPMEQCRYRCDKVIQLGCEPVPQAFIPKTAHTKTPAVLHDWTADKLRWFQRFYYMPRLWRKLKLEEYIPVKDRTPFAT